jgi:hypothetical protein
MTHSPLTDKVMVPTGKALINGRRVNKWSARPSGVKINGLNVHHWAGTNLSGLDRLVKSSDPASANYLILNDGTLVSSVPEEYRAWTTSAYANDDDKVTVEIQNETAGPEWRISALAMATLIRLYADLAKRHRFAPTRANIKGHREYGIATACPGPYLLPRLDDVARKAAALNAPSQEEEMPTAEEIAKAVWNHKTRVPSNLQKYLGKTASQRAILAATALRAERSDMTDDQIVRELREINEEN